MCIMCEMKKAAQENKKLVGTISAELREEIATTEKEFNLAFVDLEMEVLALRRQSILGELTRRGSGRAAGRVRRAAAKTRRPGGSVPRIQLGKGHARTGNRRAGARHASRTGLQNGRSIPPVGGASA